MEKLKMHSIDRTHENIAQIRSLFPNCVTEARGEDGLVKLQVDFDRLRQELSEVVIDGTQETYQLGWPGKASATLLANSGIAKTLRPMMASSVNFDGTKNIFID